MSWEKLELNLPDFNDDFILECDASDKGLGVVLRQKNGPIAYISRSLRKNEQSYSITEKEVLAVLFGMKKLESYLLGRHFKVITDHQAIVSLKTKKEFGSNRIKRWFERFERFDFTVEHRLGKEMIVADAMSRTLLQNEIYNYKELEIRKVAMKKHKENKHRKNIMQVFKDSKIYITKK